METLVTIPPSGMEIVVVYCARRTNQIQVPIGTAVIMNALKVNGLGGRLVDLTPIDPDKREEYFKKSLSPRPAIYAFGVTIGNDQINEVEKCAKIIKDTNPENIVIYGGPLPSASPKVLAAKSKADYVLAGEAEVTFPELIRRLLAGERYPNVREIPGLYYRHREEIVATPGSSCGTTAMEEATPLMQIPVNPSVSPVKPLEIIEGIVHKKLGTLEQASKPDYSQFDMDFYIGYLKETDQAWEIMGSRGCVAACSFCYKMVGNGLSVRSEEDVLDEMEWVINVHGIDKFYFVDDSLLVMRDWYRNLLKRMGERGIKCRFIVQARIDAIDEELVKEGVAHGLICISTGVESTSQMALDKMRKQTTVEQILEKLELVKRYGLAFNANMIIGFEWETEESWREMDDFIQRVMPGQVKLNLLTPLPSTTIYSQAKKNGLIGDEWEYIKRMGDLYFELMVNSTVESDETLLKWFEIIRAKGSRDVAFPISERYLKMLKDRHFERFPEEKRLRLAKEMGGTESATT
jgi:radical SAM superfamily enzyme YgiQ (UPF0313 family)